jgi:hypothetical protein
LWIAIMLFLSGCAHTGKTTAGERYPFSFAEVSNGLPTNELWRQHLALYDMNSDGMLDIVAPPPRKAAGDLNRPYIFLFDGKNNIWRNSDFVFPPLKEYGYGGIAVNDLNNDRSPDIALAVHTGNIVILTSSDAGFTYIPFRTGVPFNARAIAIDDLNGDGWNDIASIAEVEAIKKGNTKPQGILIGLNKEGKNWDARSVKESQGITGESIATGDVNGDGKRDILIAPMTMIDEQKKIVWFGDGKGDFTAYEGDIAGTLIPHAVRAGDIDGDGKDEVIIALTEAELTPSYILYSFQWDGTKFVQTPSKIELPELPIAFDTVDIDNDKKKEVVALYRGGIVLYKYAGSEWVRIGYHKLSPEESTGVYDLRAGVNRDGSILIVYNLGNEKNIKGTLNGLRAYLVKPAVKE